MGKSIAIVMSKGGAAKTTTASSLAGIATAVDDKRVLMVDMDPQGNLTSTFIRGYDGETSYDAFRALREQRSASLPVVEVRPGLAIVPAGTELGNVDTEFASFVGRPFMLKKLLLPLRGRYDMIIIDCPPSMGQLTVNALMASDEVLIPMTPDAYSADGLQQIAGLVDMANEFYAETHICGIAITRYRERRIADRIVVDQIMESRWNKYVLKTRIHENEAVRQAPLAGKDIWSYDETSRGAQDYLMLYKELKEAVKWQKETI